MGKADVNTLIDYLKEIDTTNTVEYVEFEDTIKDMEEIARIKPEILVKNYNRLAELFADLNFVMALLLRNVDEVKDEMDSLRSKD